MAERNIFVLGGSAGAAPVIARIVRELPPEFPGTLFVAVHYAPTSGADWLAQLFAEQARLSVQSPTDERRIESGTIYIARPDLHLIVKDGRVTVTHGPRENGWRPAIDVLFRSAAVAYGNRVVGLLTSGELDDGTSGLQAIKSCGGTTIVQHPYDAQHPAMLRTALANVHIDYSASTAEIPALLIRLAAQHAGAAAPIPESLRKEARMAESPKDAPALMAERGPPEQLSCPECGGPLWRGGPDRAQLRCMVGHAYHMQSLAHSSDTELDRTLWAAIRMFEQRANISRMLAEQERSHGREKRVDLYEERAREAQRHAIALRELHQQRRSVIDDLD